MAQKLFIRESAARCLNAAGRHLRLCSQVEGTESLASAISPLYELPVPGTVTRQST
jgi:hypothetical protein